MDTTAFYREFGRRVAARRRGVGLTQLDVAAAAGMARATIASIETGRQRLQVHQLYALARGLKLDDLREFLPVDVPSSDEDDPVVLFGGGGEVSSVQRAQIDVVLRTAVAAARGKGSPK